MNKRNDTCYCTCHYIHLCTVAVSSNEAATAPVLTAPVLTAPVLTETASALDALCLKIEIHNYSELETFEDWVIT